MLTEFHVSVAKTINLGNFQNVRIDVGMTIAVREGDDFGVLKLAAQQEVGKLLRETYAAQVRGGPPDGVA